MRSIKSFRVSLVAQMVKNVPAIWETWVPSLGQKNPLEKEMASYTRILAWRVPWREEPDKTQFMGLDAAEWLTKMMMMMSFGSKLWPPIYQLLFFSGCFQDILSFVFSLLGRVWYYLDMNIFEFFFLFEFHLLSHRFFWFCFTQKAFKIPVVQIGSFLLISWSSLVSPSSKFLFQSLYVSSSNLFFSAFIFMPFVSLLRLSTFHLFQGFLHLLIREWL